MRAAWLDASDAMPTAEAAALLRPACASSAWVAAMVDGRPYDLLQTLIARSDEVLAELAWPDVLDALAAHPRIGQRAAGNAREAVWSRDEQSAAGATKDAGEALRAGNVAYEQR